MKINKILYNLNEGFSAFVETDNIKDTTKLQWINIEFKILMCFIMLLPIIIFNIQKIKYKIMVKDHYMDKTYEM